MRKLLIAVLATTLAVAALRALPPPNLDRAVAAQRALVKKSPTAERWNDLGNLLALGQHTDEARDAYEKALALDPKLTTAHYNLALLLRQSGSERKAMQHLRAVTDIDPANAWAWFQIGSVYEHRGDRGPAERAYARAYALDPKLSFVDVNPQVVDSKLTTAALLLAGRARSDASEAPREYEEPHRIAKLLLPQLPGATPGPTPAPAMATAPTKPAIPATRGEDARVLRSQDLQHGGRGGAPAGVRVPSAPPTTQGYSDLLRQRLLEQQQQQEQDQQDQVDSEQPQAQPQPGSVPGVGVYVPAPRSSGQLEQRLDLPGARVPEPQQPSR